MKRYISIVLSLAMLFVCLLGPSSAEGLIGNLETDIQIHGLTELNVRMLVSRYFAQRKAYLQGTADTIETAVTPMITDEAKHKQLLTEENAVFVNSTVVIGNVVILSYRAEVEATETATFLIEGETVQESIIHVIHVYGNDDVALAVGSDGYKVNATGFISASYVNPETAELNSLIPDGSPMCILNVAMGEVGTNYSINGVTKYGTWYEECCDVGSDDYRYDFTDADWCTMFVSWCAEQCWVPDYLIPREAYAPTMVAYFDNKGWYYHSASGGGDYTPQPGDLIFFGRNTTDWFLSPGHVGIVSFVSGNVVYYVEGNAGVTVNGVTMRGVKHSQESLTSTDIVAYANPAYSNDSHPVRHGEWEYDNSMHWQDCVACGEQVLGYHNWYEAEEGYVCLICECLLRY